MDIRLTKDKFVDDRYYVDYGTNKRATFVNTQIGFYDSNRELGEVNRINIFVTQYNEEGIAISGASSTSVIGIGDMITGIRLGDINDTHLLGKLLTWDNMDRCVVTLYE